MREWLRSMPRMVGRVEHIAMTRPMVIGTTAMRRAICLCWFYVTALALTGCWSAAPQAEPPAGSYRAQDFEVRAAGAAEQFNVKGAAVSDDFFAAGRIQPLLGRAILRDEHRSMQVALISYRLWNSKFHADPAVLGTTLEVNGQNVTIVGVMPKDFSVPDGAQLWVPLVAR